MILVIKPIKALLTRDTNYLTSMDPYCILFLGEQVRKTSPHFGGGKTPVWGQVFKFQIGRVSQLGIEVWSKSILGNDSLIGHAIIELNKTNIGYHQIIQETVVLYYDKNPIGKVLLELQIVNTSNIYQNVQASNLMNQNMSALTRNNEITQHMTSGDRNDCNNNLNVLRKSSLQQKSTMSKSYNTTEERKNRFVNNQMNNCMILDQRKNKIFTNREIGNPNQNLISLQNLNSAIQPNNSQQQINQFLNKQIFNSIVNNLSSSQVNQTTSQTSSKIKNNYDLKQSQQMMNSYYDYQFLHQDKMNYQDNNSFTNINNLSKLNTGSTIETILPKTHHLKGSQTSIKTATTPPKSILSKSKSKAKSPGHKKVKFADQIM